MREYDQIAAWYVAARSPEVGIIDLGTFVRRLSPRARVLDLGCGDGVPISRFLYREGFDIVALDSSPEMIARYRTNFPGVPTRCERAQEADFAAGSFDAVVAWGMLFHLSPEDQRALIWKVSEWLRPGGRFLFTSGDVEDASEGDMNGVTLPYASLGMSGYRDVIEEAGMRLDINRRDEWNNHVYVAEKAAQPVAEG